MNYTLNLIIGIAGATILTTARAAAPADVKPIPVTGMIQWVHGYEAGQKLARETGKPMFVVFRCER